MSELHPEGVFQAKCCEWALIETKSGAPQVYLVLEKPDGSRLPAYYGSLSEAALPYTLKALRNCGWAGSDIMELDHASCGMDKNIVEAVVMHEEYDGKTRAKVKWLNIPGAIMATPLSADKKAAFAQQLKANILRLEMDKPKAPTQQRQTEPPPGHPANVDIPF